MLTKRQRNDPKKNTSPHVIENESLPDRSVLPQFVQLPLFNMELLATLTRSQRKQSDKRNQLNFQIDLFSNCIMLFPPKFVFQLSTV